MRTGALPTSRPSTSSVFAQIIPTAPACCTAVAFSAKLASPRTTSAMCPEMADAFAIAVCALHARPAS